MRFCSLGSGSEGNALLLEAGVDALGAIRQGGESRAYRVLVDCGFGLRELEKRLSAVGLAPHQIDAVLVTHEHGDHIGGVYRLAQAFDVPVYLTHGTHRNGPASGKSRLNFIDPHQTFELPGLKVEPIAVPHDAGEPVQYVLDDGVSRLGVLTDLGHVTAHICEMLSQVDALVLECNHDTDLLANNPKYPAMLKRRIGGDYGHLSNFQATEVLLALQGSSLKRVVGAHLSQSNNQPELALLALKLGAEQQALDIQIASQGNGFDWMAA